MKDRKYKVKKAVRCPVQDKKERRRKEKDKR